MLKNSKMLFIPCDVAMSHLSFWYFNILMEFEISMTEKNRKVKKFFT